MIPNLNWILIDLKFGYVVFNNKGHVKLEFWVLKLWEAGAFVSRHWHISVILDNVISAVELCCFKLIKNKIYWLFWVQMYMWKWDRWNILLYRARIKLFIFIEIWSNNKSDSTHHFFRNACTKSGSLRFSQFSGCWLILSVYIPMSFDFPFVRLFGVR